MSCSGVLAGAPVDGALLLEGAPFDVTRGTNIAATAAAVVRQAARASELATAGFAERKHPPPKRHAASTKVRVHTPPVGHTGMPVGHTGGGDFGNIEFALAM